MNEAERNFIEDFKECLSNGWDIKDLHVAKGGEGFEGENELNITIQRNGYDKEIWIPSKSMDFFADMSNIAFKSILDKQ